MVKPFCDLSTGGLNTKAMVKIKVTDVNDNRPVFYPAIYSVNVNENTPVNTPIITVQASDPDSGPFGEITYRLTSPNTEGFVVHPSTGKSDWGDNVHS